MDIHTFLKFLRTLIKTWQRICVQNKYFLISISNTKTTQWTLEDFSHNKMYKWSLNISSVQTPQSWAKCKLKAQENTTTYPSKLLKLKTDKLVSPNVLFTAAAVSLQSCSTLCDPIDGSPPGSPIPGILQARIYWSGVPLPSPMHESEKWKWSRSVVSHS